MTPSSLRVVSEYVPHRKVSKSCRWRDEHLIASADDCGDLALLDTRLPPERAATVLPEAHDSMIHTVRWSPADDNAFFSAGNDAVIRLWDVRKLHASKAARPLFEMSGHFSPKATKTDLSGIFAPSFCQGGKFISTMGDKNRPRVSIYSASTGATISRGDIRLRCGKGATVQALPTCDVMPEEVVAAASGTDLIFLLPCYGPA